MIVRWSKQPGDRVEADEPVGIVEVDVAQFELFAPHSGVLAETLAEPGETVAVGRALARFRAARA